MTETFNAAGPYLTDRMDVQAWADNGDENAAEYLDASASCPAPIFGIDDGEVRVWFATQEKADKWLADMLADAAEQRA